VIPAEDAMNDDFQSRLDHVRERVAAACARAGRDPSGVNILAVTKTFGPAQVEEAAECGLTVFGESRVQEARQKIPLCSGNLEWHMVGHLQRNKVKETVQLFRMIHSIDSMRLLEAVNSACEAAGVEMPVCLEVNVSGEGSKFGMKPEEVVPVLEQSSNLVSVSVVGLMTIPPYSEDVEKARSHFKALRELRDECVKKTGAALNELSMGMSGDFEVAVEEGATWIRLGTILFGDRPAAQDDAAGEGP